MENEDFATELESILSYDKEEVLRSVLALVTKKLEDVRPPAAAEIIKVIEDSNLVHKTMTDWANRWVANEVGNRLRCGIWNGTDVDRVFDSIWTEQFDIAIRDRIRSKVNAAIDAIIKDRLVAIQSK